MKGIIFNLLEQFITETAGEEIYQTILDRCSLQTREPFVGPGTYPDEDLTALVKSTVTVLGISPPEALRRFGKFAFPKLAEHFPDFVSPHRHPKEFLKTVDSIIHVEVRKLYENAKVPSFLYRDPAPDRLVIEYRSDRRLCHFMEGLIEGVADHFRSPVGYRQTRCMLRGDEVCEFDLCFEP